LGSIDWSPKIIDFSDVYRGGFSNCFANEMIDAIQAALAAKKRALLIVNRKGEASSLVCADCDFCAKCKTCDLPLNVVGAELRCFRCGDKKDMILSCPKCGGSNLKKRGIGIDQVAKEAQRLFPSTQIEVVHGEVAANLSGDIVIATADILNYPNWPKFSILGVVYADGAVYSPDYLSNSRLYEFLNELVLRAKTDGASPRVIVQTRFAENPAIKFFGLPYSDFFEQEMEFRKQFKYPPFVNLIKLISQGDDDNAVCAAANALFDKLNKCQQSLGFGHLDLVISPPYPFYAKQVRKRFRWQILLKINRGIEFERKLMELVPKDCLIDKDPISLL
jgi:primosomal protein N' (replication factor Y)